MVDETNTPENNAPEHESLEDIAAAAEQAEQEYIPRDEPGAETKESPAEISTAELLAAVLKPTFAIVCPAWKITDKETQSLADAYGKVLDKYFPDLSFGVELEALMITVIVFGPRYGKPSKVEEKAEDAPA